MSGYHPPVISPQPYSLITEAASSLVSRIPELLRRLRDLQNEEAILDAQARQLVEQLSEANDRPSAPSHPIISTPISKVHIRATESAVDRSDPSTPPHIDPSICLPIDLNNY